MGDSGGGNLAAAAAAAPLQLSSLPRRRLSEWPAKPAGLVAAVTPSSGAEDQKMEPATSTPASRRVHGRGGGGEGAAGSRPEASDMALATTSSSGAVELGSGRI